MDICLSPSVQEKGDDLVVPTGACIVERRVAQLRGGEERKECQKGLREREVESSYKIFDVDLRPLVQEKGDGLVMAIGAGVVERCVE